MGLSGHRGWAHPTEVAIQLAASHETAGGKPRRHHSKIWLKISATAIEYVLDAYAPAANKVHNQKPLEVVGVAHGRSLSSCLRTMAALLHPCIFYA